MLKRIALVPILMVLATLALGNTLICIDPGHGGTDPGAVGYVTEKGINLDVSLMMREWMNLDTVDTRGGSEWDVIMTRSTDITVSLEARVNYANSNNADRFMWIHSNMVNKETANGSESYCKTGGSAECFDLRNKMQEELLAHGQRANRGNKTSSSYYTLNNINMPGALGEMAFVSNYADSQCLINPTWQNEVAKGYLHAIQRHMGYTDYTPSYQEYIIDNSDAGYAEVGAWATSTNPGYYGTNSRYSDSGVGNDTATWTPNIVSGGYYNVYAWWVSGTDRASNAPYAITHASGTANLMVNQSANGGQWNLLGNYAFNSGTSGKAVLTDNAEAGKVVSADAIKFSQSGTPTPTPTPTPIPGTDVIVDNDDGSPAYTETGTWTTGTPGYNGLTYRYATVTEADTATWNGTLSQTGNYQVFVFYTASSNRSIGAKFTVHTSSGDQVVMVDQTINGQTWFSLGTFAFNAGSNSITLDAAGSSGTKRKVVVADAVRFTLQ